MKTFLTLLCLSLLSVVLWQGCYIRVQEDNVKHNREVTRTYHGTIQEIINILQKNEYRLLVRFHYLYNQDLEVYTLNKTAVCDIDGVYVTHEKIFDHIKSNIGVWKVSLDATNDRVITRLTLITKGNR